MHIKNTINRNGQSTVQFLEDRTKSGKKRDWQGKKQRSLLTAEHFKVAGLTSKAERMRDVRISLSLGGQMKG